MQNELLADEKVEEVIKSYHYEDFSRYTVCNIMTVDGGLDFYHDYSSMMRSSVSISQIQATDEYGNPVYTESRKSDALGNIHSVYTPVYFKNSDGVTWFSSWSLLLLNKFLLP